jgi:predicted permease
MPSDLFLRLRSLFRRNAVESELDDGLRFHLKGLIESYMRHGLSRDEAIRRAGLEFGGLDQIREAHRDVRGIALLADLGRDARYAVRQLRRSPAFAVSALLCLALGIGATTAIFSVVNAILLQPLPYPDSDRLVLLVENVPSSIPGRPPSRRAHTFQEFLDWQSQSRTLSDGVAMGGVGQRLVRTPQGVVGLWGTTATLNAFNVFGVPSVIFKLSPGASLEAAREEANVLGAAMRPPLPANSAALTVPRFDVQRLRDRDVQEIAPALRLFLAAVVVVLVIVCANVANLLLARGTARQREIALRFAIGASRMRVIRQIMTESLVLALAGGALGSVLAAGGVWVIKQLATIDAPGIYRLMFGTTILPRTNEVAVDVRVLGVSLALAVVTSVVFGVLPALAVSRSTRVTAVRAPVSAGHAESRIRSALVVAQLVMATVLLVGGGLLANSFVKLSRVNNGYDPSNVLAFNLLFPDQYSVGRKAETIDRLLTRIRTSTSVRSVGFARHGLLIGEELFIGSWLPPRRAPEDMRDARTRVRSVSDGYLPAMGVPLLAGRTFEVRDNATAQPVIVMSRSASRQYFGTDSAVGRVIDWHFAEQVHPMTVIGIVEDIRQESPTDEVFPEIFLDYRQFLSLMDRTKQPPPRQDAFVIGFLSFAIRTTGDPASLVPQIRQIVHSVDPEAGIDAIVPMSRLAARRSVSMAC